MSTALAFKIVGGVLALLLGIYLGMPARYEQSIEEIDAVMESGTGRRKKVKRRFTAMAWMQRQISVGTRGHKGGGRGLSMKAPDDR